MFGLLGLVRDILILGVLVAAGFLLSLTPTSYTVDAPPVATTTPPAVATTSPPVVVATTTTPTPVVPKPAPKPVPKQATPPPPTPKVEEMNVTLDEAIKSIENAAAGQVVGTVNERARAALVNILCTTDASGPFESISGSGIIIDPRGVILTNAHVAQFFLIKDYPYPGFVDCVIRSGSPARPLYSAELLYIPPLWVTTNAHKIDDEAPTGTGERDYALLRITGTVAPSVSPPPQFPFLLVALGDPDIGTDVLQAGYAAGFLGGITVQNDLYASSAWTKIRDIFTFNANTVDLVSLGGSIVAQQGSSGGPVVNQDGILIGMIVTSTSSVDTSGRDLRAITTSYIVRDFESGRGKSLQALLSTENLAGEAAIYSSVYAPSARQALISEIEK